MDPQHTPRTTSPGPAILVIFGVTGDLARRYLMPSLYRLFRDNLLDEKTEVIGVSRRNIDLDDLFNKVEMCVNETDNVCDPVVMARMHSRTRVHQLDMDDPAAFAGLHKLLDDIEAEQGVCMDRLYYLSIPPAAYTNVIKNMGEGGLQQACAHGNGQSRLLVEKPFGHDLASAEMLVKATAEIFQEEQVFRIDHYLAKETAQNIMTFRFENPIFEPVWNGQHIASIDIAASEKIGIEGRAEFYEAQGALRDLVQNHLLQLLAVTAMERPEQLDSAGIHATKLRLLQAVAPIAADQVAQQAIRGQYNGYCDEVSNPDSFVETFASIHTTITNEQWQQVPVTIRTGKSLAEKATAVTITFKERHSEFPNQLRFNIDPNEGIELSLLAKKPGFEHELQTVSMVFSYAQNFNGAQPSAYERVLLDAVRGDRTLFASSDEVLAAWRIIDAVVAAWNKNGEGLLHYEQGSAIEELDKPAIAPSTGQ